MKLLKLASLLCALLIANNSYSIIISLSILERDNKKVILIGDYHLSGKRTQMKVHHDKIGYQVLTNLILNAVNKSDFGKTRFIYEKAMGLENFDIKWARSTYKYLGALQEFLCLTFLDRLKIGNVDFEAYNPRISLPINIYDSKHTATVSRGFKLRTDKKFFEICRECADIYILKAFVEEINAILEKYKSIIPKNISEQLNLEIEQFEVNCFPEGSESVIENILIDRSKIAKIRDVYDEIFNIQDKLFDTILIGKLLREVLPSNQTAIVYVGDAHVSVLSQRLKNEKFNVVCEYRNCPIDEDWSPEHALSKDIICEILGLDSSKIVTDQKNIDVEVERLRETLKHSMKNETI